MKAFWILIFIAGAKLTVKGEENVPKDRPVLYVPNHRSIFDIIITYVRCPLQTGYVAKKEIRKIPVFSTWMAFMNCYFLDRSDIRDGLKMINHCITQINNGSSITIFPEGTRNKTYDVAVQEFHEGSFRIAEKTRCTIIPVTLNGTGGVFEDQFPRIKRRHVIIEYGKPIETNDMTKEELRSLGKRCHDIVESTYLKNQELI